MNYQYQCIPVIESFFMKTIDEKRVFTIQYFNSYTKHAKCCMYLFYFNYLYYMYHEFLKNYFNYKGDNTFVYEWFAGIICIILLLQI